MMTNGGGQLGDRIILDVAAIGGTNSLFGFTGGTVIGGTEIGGSCPAGLPPSSDAACATLIVSGTVPSTTPLPATLPLMGSGLLGLWAYLRRRKAQPKEPFGMVGG